MIESKHTPEKIEGILTPAIWTADGLDERRRAVGTFAFSQEYLLDAAPGTGRGPGQKGRTAHKGR